MPWQRPLENLQDVSRRAVPLFQPLVYTGVLGLLFASRSADSLADSGEEAVNVREGSLLGSDPSEETHTQKMRSEVLEGNSFSWQKPSRLLVHPGHQPLSPFWRPLACRPLVFLHSLQKVS